ncbi:MAG: regulatory iron-sulfur-containing complex subunit RicT, partial [Pirellulales bacterium]
EGRIDFRELVKRLAAEFQTRIEMKQVGVRDEAKLLADYGDCGKPLCCNTHLVEMPPVSMKMAKLQKATLDPNKISGRCGRLKCCLRYEYDTYEENRKTMPSVGTDIVTAEGRARVIGQDLLTRQLVIAMEDNRRVIIATDQVLSVLRRSAASEPPDQDESERAESDKTADSNEEPGRRRDGSNPRSDRGGHRGRPQRERRDERNGDRNGDRNDEAKREQRIEDNSSEDKNTERVAEASVPQDNAPVDEGTIEPKSE